MFYLQCKIYNDGGHFIALPHTTRSGLRKRPKPPDELKLGLVGQLNRCVCLSAPQSGALVSKTSTHTGAKKCFYYSIKKSFSYVSPALSEILSGEKSLSGKPLESVNSVSQSAVIKTLTSPFKRVSRTFTPQRVRQ